MHCIRIWIQDKAASGQTIRTWHSLPLPVTFTTLAHWPPRMEQVALKVKWTLFNARFVFRCT
jgi:hypothetical protein